MAHDNIDERRKMVKDAFDANGFLTPSQRKELGQMFRCSPNAIWSDILVLINGSTFHVLPSMKKKIILRDGNTCYICGRKTDKPMIEHKMPARAGGRAVEENLAVACQSCNTKKRFTDKILYPY